MEKLLNDYDVAMKKLEELKEEYDDYYFTKLRDRDLLEKQIEYLEKYIDILAKRIYGYEQ